MKHRLIATSLAAALAVTSLASPAFAQGHDNHNNGPQGHGGWDNDHNNGYYLGNTWHYGTPSSSVQSRHDYRPGWQSWRRGQRLPSYYRSHYQVVTDYRSRHLSRPRPGYHYVRDDNGNILLVAIATGLIASIIASH